MRGKCTCTTPARLSTRRRLKMRAGRRHPSVPSVVLRAEALGADGHRRAQCNAVVVLEHAVLQQTLAWRSRLGRRRHANGLRGVERLATAMAPGLHVVHPACQRCELLQHVRPLGCPHAREPQAVVDGEVSDAGAQCQPSSPGACNRWLRRRRLDLIAARASGARGRTMPPTIASRSRVNACAASLHARHACVRPASGRQSWSQNKVVSAQCARMRARPFEGSG